MKMDFTFVRREEVYCVYYEEVMCVCVWCKIVYKIHLSY